MSILSLRAIILFYALIWLPLFSIAKNEEKYDKNQAIVIGIPNAEPLAWHEDQIAKGQFVLIAKEAFSRIKGSAVFAPETPFPRSLAELETGKIDALIPMFFSEERKQKFVFPAKEMGRGRMSFFTIKGNKIDFNGDFSVFKGLTVGSLAGSSPGLGNADFEKAIAEKRVTVQHFKDFSQGLSMLKMNRVNAICGNQNIIRHLAKKNGIELDEISPPILEAKFYMIFSKRRDYSELISKLEKAFSDMEKDGTTAKILKNFNQ